jgi:hypothetical protein
MTSTGVPATREGSAWATGFAAFASAMMILFGTIQALEGLAALFNDEFFVRSPNYTFELDITAWGWIHLIFGVIIGWAGVSLLRGAMWARVVGIVVAALSAIANFMWLPYYPLWATVVIGLAVVTIWALTQYQPSTLRSWDSIPE